jgi:hypothetical protein
MCLVKLPWKASDYANALPPRPNGFAGPVEEKLEELFPPLFSKPFPLVSKPSCLVDSDGIILAWYLPDGLTCSRQASLFPSSSASFLTLVHRCTSGML